MGEYKDKHGQTRVGKFLRNAAEAGKEIAPEVLDIAGDLTGVDALKRLGAAIDKDEKMQAEDKELALEMLKLDIADKKSERENVTKRHGNDMASDSWLSKNVRPIVLMFSWLFLSVIVTIDAASKSFNVPEFYLNLLVPLLLTVTGFYFGGRTLEKYKINKKNLL